MTGDNADQLKVMGMVAATVASLFWAIAVVLYRRVGTVMPPVRLNFVKALVASILIGVAVLIEWRLFGRTPWHMTHTMLALMALSGVIGIAVGDTLFFAGLNRIGSRRSLLLFTINPVFTVLIAWPVLDEPLTLWQVLGVALTCGGVAWVIAERAGERSDGHVDTLGVVYCIGAATCQAIGVLMSRYLFDQGEMTATASAWLRITASGAALAIMLPLDRLLADPGGEAHHHPRAPSRGRATLMFAVAMLLGTVLGITLMQVSVKHAGEVGIAATLLSLSPLFVLPIAALTGDRLSRRAILGALITIAGVALLYSVSA